MFGSLFSLCSAFNLRSDHFFYLSVDHIFHLGVLHKILELARIGKSLGDLLGQRLDLLVELSSSFLFGFYCCSH